MKDYISKLLIVLKMKKQKRDPKAGFHFNDKGEGIYQ